MTQIKIKDFIKKNQELNIKFTSFELCPTKNCHSTRIEFDEHFCFTETPHSFFSVVWKLPYDDKVTRENVSSIPPIKFAKELVEKGDIVLLHINGGNMTKNMFKIVLDECQKNSIKNIFLVKGDEVKANNDDEYFKYVHQMISFIKDQFEDYFCIGVAGFPDIHPNCSDTKIYFEHLKQKVDAGADFIITQYFFGPEKLVSFVQLCKTYEITIPIIPGFCIFPSFECMLRMKDITKVAIPENFMDNVKDLKNNNVKFLEAMIEYVKNMVREVQYCLETLPGIHWFTFNRIDTVSSMYKVNPFISSKYMPQLKY